MEYEIECKITKEYKKNYLGFTFQSNFIHNRIFQTKNFLVIKRVFLSMSYESILDNNTKHYFHKMLSKTKKKNKFNTIYNKREKTVKKSFCFESKNIK